jgi:hypothetical protein
MWVGRLEGLCVYACGWVEGMRVCVTLSCLAPTVVLLSGDPWV